MRGRYVDLRIFDDQKTMVDDIKKKKLTSRDDLGGTLTFDLVLPDSFLLLPLRTEVFHESSMV